MISGSADPEALAVGRPSLASLPKAPLVLGMVETVQALFEMPVRARESLLPPGLHPTNPAGCFLLAWRVEDGPLGPFQLVQVRAQCRSGLRPRGFVVGAVCDSEAAGGVLASEWGFPIRAGEIALQRGYDRVSLQVAVAGRTVLDFEGRDPDPLAPGDVQYSSTLNLARIDRGLRLIQVEPEIAIERAERLRPSLRAFDPVAWGHPGLAPVQPVAASITRGTWTLPPVRFVCRPDVIAFQGTEPA